MKYEKPNINIVILEDEMLPMTQISSGDPFGDIDNDGLPEEQQ